MKRVAVLWVGVLSLALVAFGTLPAVAWGTLSHSEAPGSVLVFHKFQRGTFNDLAVSGQGNHALTELEISVRCPDGATCTKNQVVRMRAHWVCRGCGTTSFDLETTVGGTLYFNPEGVTVVGGVITAPAFPSNATTTIPAPQCGEGYLIVWAVDGGGNAIKFDGLIGDAVIRGDPFFLGGSSANSARGYNAIPIQAAEFLSTGARTDRNGNAALDFNGSEYQMVTGRIFGTVRYDNLGNANNVIPYLTLLTLDVASNRPNPTTFVGLNFYTADEDLVDTGTSFLCWESQQLFGINTSLTVQRMGRKGLVESTFAEQNGVPVTLLGIVETLELASNLAIVRDYAYSLYNDGNPVATTFRP